MVCRIKGSKEVLLVMDDVPPNFVGLGDQDKGARITILARQLRSTQLALSAVPLTGHKSVAVVNNATDMPKSAC